MIVIIITYILLNCLAGLLGSVEGILYSRKGHEAFSFDEHLGYIVQRGLICVLLILFTLLTLTEATVLVGLWMLSFSFYHNGFYYVTRHYIDVKKYNFGSSSDTSSAWLELNWNQRLTLNIVSVIGLIIYLIYF